MESQLSSTKVLIIEDTESLARLFQSYLIPAGIDAKIAATGQQGLDMIAQNKPDLVLLDVVLPDINGMDVLEKISKQDNKPDVVVMTAHGTKELAVQAIRLGAVDFLEKPVDAARLRVTVNNAIKLKHLSQKVEEYQTVFDQGQFCNLIGSSLEMQSVYQIIQSAAASKASVFITGESGTGKELCAEAIHLCSKRKDNNFVALNCAAIPKDLIESEIFGHVKGAFTGATSSRQGAAEQANGGTLFFDEICEMDLSLQSKLLRFIQTGTFQKVGAEQLQSVDVRFVCATNRDPWFEVQAGNFREDLYYRLHVIPIHAPPLRERNTDIIEIADYFFNKIAKEEGKPYSGLSEATKTKLMQYGWPGNVRQLENTVRNVIVLNNAEWIEPQMLPTLLGDPTVTASHSISPQVNEGQMSVSASQSAEIEIESLAIIDRKIMPLWIVEKDYIEKSIKQCSGNVAKAAAMLEVSPSTIYRKMKDWEHK
jgi:two-component system repressor protein LuxO